MKKILIIEDDQKIALALCVRLKANGYTTWMAGDSITGLSISVDDNGVVTLSGHLPRDKRAAAVGDAQKVKGVSRVVDNITLD